MYICGICTTQVGPKVPSNIITVETRQRKYPARPGVGDPGGSGYETVREINACPSCAEGKL